MRTIVIISCFLFSLQAYDAVKMDALARSLHLHAGEKASIQWKRIFSSPRHMKRYHLENLDMDTRDDLRCFLVEHAADSDKPIIPGL